MKNVDVVVGESNECVVKRASQQCRKILIVEMIIQRKLLESRLVIETRLRVARPSINSKTTSGGLVFSCGLAEGEITFASVRSQFYESPRPFQRNEVVGEKNMMRPCADAVNARLEFARWQIGGDERWLHKTCTIGLVVRACLT